ncbi:MAG: DUF3530 family protein, partial [Gammaproteobacteria bacterium]
ATLRLTLTASLLLLSLSLSTASPSSSPPSPSQASSSPPSPAAIRSPFEQALDTEQRHSKDLMLYVHDTSNREWITSDDGTRFLSLYQADQTGDDRGLVVLLPGLQQHPASSQILNTFRLQLPQQGWSTLSVSLPNDPDLIEGSLAAQQQQQQSDQQSDTASTVTPTPEQDATLEVPPFPSLTVLLEHFTARLRATANKIQEKNAQSVHIVAFDISALWLFESLDAGLSIPNLQAIVMIDGFQPSTYTHINLIKASINSSYALFDIAHKHPQAIYQSHLRAIRAKQKDRQHYRHFVMRNRGFIRSDETQIDQGRLVNIVQSWLRNNQTNQQNE